jgi:hypothetical protein
MAALRIDTRRESAKPSLLTQTSVLPTSGGNCQPIWHKISAAGEKVCPLNNFKLHESFLSENRTFCAQFSEKTYIILAFSLSYSVGPFRVLHPNIRPAVNITQSPIRLPSPPHLLVVLYSPIYRLLSTPVQVVYRHKLYKDDFTLISQFLHAYA